METCDRCDPSLAEQIVAKSTTDRKLWMGHEADPTKYKKVEGPDGETIFRATDEHRVDHEAEWTKQDDDQDMKAERILATRKQFGRKSPLSPSEVLERIAQVRNQLVKAELVTE